MKESGSGIQAPAFPNRHAYKIVHCCGRALLYAVAWDVLVGIACVDAWCNFWVNLLVIRGAALLKLSHGTSTPCLSR